jgi:Cu-processing system ATP-binding protein
MIEISGLNKRYGRLTVLDGLDLEIRPGAVTAVLGPNGAGKTTLIKSILGLVHPESGEIRFGGELLGSSSEYRRRIGYMPQIPRYPENLKVGEIISMIRDLRGNPEEVDEELAVAFDLSREMDKPFKALSGGTRQKVSAVLAFLFRAELLILDEPTAGLDPISSSRLKDKVARERDAGRTIILTSHIMSEVEELADRVVYLLDGRIHFDVEVADFVAGSGETNLERALARQLGRVA